MNNTELPDELITEIFGFLDYQNLWRLSLVCKKWTFIIQYISVTLSKQIMNQYLNELQPLSCGSNNLASKQSLAPTLSSIYCHLNNEIEMLMSNSDNSKKHEPTLQQLNNFSPLAINYYRNVIQFIVDINLRRMWSKIMHQFKQRIKTNQNLSSQEISELFGSEEIKTILLQVTTLDLAWCNLTRVPFELSQLNLLQELHLNNNQLTVLPSQIGQLCRLQDLHLNNNRITAISPKIGQLRQLQCLFLVNNQLTLLPSEIGQLIQLQVLNINNNQLTTLPSEIGQLVQLQSLNLDDNCLSSLPPQIGQLNQLKYLFVENNQLVVLPSEIVLLNQLQELGLSNNKLISISMDVGKYLIQLQSIYLDTDQLSILPREIIVQTSQLKVHIKKKNPPQNWISALGTKLWSVFKRFK